jgi:trehalose 6-phosphate synthase/phosphatase
MDSMHPDPEPQPPQCLEDIREQVARLEAGHRARGLPLSGRIIHVFHHLPVEIVCATSSPPEQFNNLSSPITPEFKPEDSTALESANQKWTIHARRGHTAMISGIRSLSDTHEQLVVAWTGDVLLQHPTTSSGQAPKKQDQPKMLLEDTIELHPMVTDDTPLTVFNGEFEKEEELEIESELRRFSALQYANEGSGKLEYIPVFVPKDVSKGHYEGYCKTSELNDCVCN